MVLEGIAWAFGILVHRDYFTLSFTHIAVWFMLLSHWLNTLHSGALRKETKRDLGRAFMILFLIIIFWIMLMGYTIATRSEPRPIQALIYNSYNALVAFAIQLLSRILVAALYRTLVRPYGPGGPRGRLR
ncbi:MAG: hypothetical protein WCL50_11965 [Spirochaetota bacterium]